MARMRRKIETITNKQNKKDYPPHNSQKRTLRTRISKTIRKEERNGREGLPQVL